MADATFWNARLRRHGHTGWADAAIYAYDQRLRLRAVAGLLDAGVPGARQHALDFGCGVGDFSALLAARFARVTAHDISGDILSAARSRVPNVNVQWTPDRAAALAGGPHDLILSITVLQHLQDDAELQRLLHAFAAVLGGAGRVVVLETLAADDASAAVAPHLRLRTLAQLLAAFDAAGLRLLQRQAFHHPVDDPTPGFARFRARGDVRLLRRLAGAGLAWARHRLDVLAARAAAHDADALGALGSAGATQLMVFGPAGPGDAA